jgi:hypothetical protein
MTKDKLFERTIVINHSIDFVWNTFSDINLLCHWHPLMFPVETISCDNGVFDQDIVEDNELIRKRLIIRIVDRIEKQKLILSIRPYEWETDILHNIAEFNFNSVDDKTEITFCRYFSGQNINKRNQIVSFAEEIVNSIENLKFNGDVTDTGLLHLSRK